MSTDIFVIIVGILSLIIGVFIGIKFFKYHDRKQNRKILENAEEVLSGRRENKIKIDGEEYNATRFRVRGKDNEEVIIDLQEGGEIQNGNENEISSGTEGIQNEKVETVRETSSGSGEKKRITRVGLSRIRRFG